MTNPLKNMIASRGMLIVLVAFANVALAQPSGGSPPGGAAAGPGSAAPASEPPAPAPAPPAAPAPAMDARKACADAMNVDPTFAAEIVKIADEKAAAMRDNDTIAAHKDAVAHVQKNERHVIYAYAAMWIVAALFVIFLWRRQQALQAEIANLRRDLEAAADESRTGKAQT